MLRVVINLEMKGNIPRGRPRLRWLDNIDNHLNHKKRIDTHLKVKKTSLKEVLETKCFENRQDWRTIISRTTNRSSGEDH